MLRTVFGSELVRPALHAAPPHLLLPVPTVLQTLRERPTRLSRGHLTLRASRTPGSVRTTWLLPGQAPAAWSRDGPIG